MGEPCSLCGQAVEVWRFDIGVSVAPCDGALVVCHKENDVRSSSSGFGAEANQQEGEQKKFHTGQGEWAVEHLTQGGRFRRYPMRAGMETWPHASGSL